MLLLSLSALVLLPVPLGSLGAEMKTYSQRTATNACTLVTCSPLETGLPGRDGRDGREGPRGEKGDTGLPGAAGQAGLPGSIGPAGPKGSNGSAGEPGPKGDSGPRGLPGTPGPAGREGPPGRQGDVGPQGKPGPKGELGPKGEAGAMGLQGPAGIRGPTGPKGERGAPGERGVPGNVGIGGPVGAAGAQGPPGVRGPPGLKGDRGPKGDSGLPDMAALRQQVEALQGQVQRLQAGFFQYKKVALFPNGRGVGEKIFKTSGSKGSFEDAQLVCTGAGGQVASPRSAAENAALEQLLSAHNTAAFLSVTDIQAEGKFTYPSGEPLAYSNWAPGEPNNNGGAEDCVEILTNGKWNDKSCGEQHLVVCEF